MANQQSIPMDQLMAGGIYRLHSRNLAFGVWLPDQKGFSGIREKFWRRSLFTEYHYDTGAPFGTAHPIELVGHVPTGTELVESRTLCQVCRQPVDFDRERGESAEERWQHTDSALNGGDHPAQAAHYNNPDIWDALEAVESAEAERLRAAGELWKGNELHHFVLQTPEQAAAGDYEGEEVDADAYFDAQHEAGVCMGVHYFTSNTVCGYVHTKWATS